MGRTKGEGEYAIQYNEQASARAPSVPSSCGPSHWGSLDKVQDYIHPEGVVTLRGDDHEKVQSRELP